MNRGCFERAVRIRTLYGLLKMKVCENRSYSSMMQRLRNMRTDEREPLSSFLQRLFFSPIASVATASAVLSACQQPLKKLVVNRHAAHDFGRYIGCKRHDGKRQQIRKNPRHLTYEDYACNRCSYYGGKISRHTQYDEVGSVCTGVTHQRTDNFGEQPSRYSTKHQQRQENSSRRSGTEAEYRKNKLH